MKGLPVSAGFVAMLATLILLPPAAHGARGTNPIPPGCDPFALSDPATARVAISEGAPAELIEPNVEQAYRRALARWPRDKPPEARVAGPIRIGVYVHVIQDSAGAGVIPPERIASQIDVLNSAFNGTTGGDNTGITFELVDTDVTVNADWSPLEQFSPEETAMKAALREGGARALNLYVVDLPPPALGWGIFPQVYDNLPSYDGVVVENDSLPGGPPPYGEGDTATHEAGHWLGLFHTFQGGCTPPGDFVDDTAAEAGDQLVVGCPVDRDTCPAAPGLDPVQNFMSYADDACIDRFTPGQTERMHQLTGEFRNGPPTASAERISTLAGRSVVVRVEASDPDGDVISHSVTDPPDHGRVQRRGAAAFTYEPKAGYRGRDSFTVQVADVFGVTDEAVIRVEVDRGLALKADGRQRVRRLAVTGNCGNDECRVVATGRIVARDSGAGKGARAARTFKLKRASGRAQPNRSAKLRLRVARSKRRLLRLLENGWRAKAKVTVTATGPSDQKSTEKASIVVTR